MMQTRRAAALREERAMPRGSKEAYTDKQKRQAEHIEDSYKERGVSDDLAEARAWATVNKESGGGKKSGSGRKGAVKKATKQPSSRTRKTVAKKATKKAPASGKTATKRSTSRSRKRRAT